MVLVRGEFPSKVLASLLHITQKHRGGTEQPNVTKGTTTTSKPQGQLSSFQTYSIFSFNTC